MLHCSSKMYSKFIVNIMRFLSENSRTESLAHVINTNFWGQALILSVRNSLADIFDTPNAETVYPEVFDKESHPFKYYVYLCVFVKVNIFVTVIFKTCSYLWFYSRICNFCIWSYVRLSEMSLFASTMPRKSISSQFVTTSETQHFLAILNTLK